MRLVHLSDLHLGFRQFQRQTQTGANQREADVALVFTRAIDATIALEPDVVLIAGDVFHFVRPTNAAILTAFIQFSKLVQQLPKVRVVIAAGNHDLPKTSEAGTILTLFGRLERIDVATFQSKRVPLPEFNASVLAVPHTLTNRPDFSTEPSAKYNVLLMHALTPDVVPHWVGENDRAIIAVTPESWRKYHWDYVALGHYHVYRKLDFSRNEYFSGSTEYASTNPWFDLFEERDLKVPGKGFIEHDLATGRHVFHSLELERQHVDLPPIEARGMSAAELDDAIRKTVESVRGGIDEKIVRLVVREVPRHIVRELDHRALRDYRRRALSFQLDPRKPESIRRDVSGGPGRRASLAETVREKLQMRPLPSDIDREQLVALGLEYLSEAEQLETAPSLGSDAAAP